MPNSDLHDLIQTKKDDVLARVNEGLQALGLDVDLSSIDVPGD